MLNKTIYFDEAGNTGPNLLDTTQPYHILLSHNFNDRETLEILSRILNEKIQGNELHFSSLKRKYKYQQLINEIINIPDLEGRVFYSTSDKSFCIVGQIVDQLMEPVFYDMGYDLYQSAGNLQLTNYIYFQGNHHWNKNLFDTMCSSFYSLIKNKSQEDIENFYHAVFKLYNSLNPQDKTMIFPLLISRNQIGEILESVEKYTLDITLSNFIVQCNEWGKRLDDNINVIFDDSRQLEYYKEFILFHTKNMPPQEAGYGSRKLKYPLPIDGINATSSENNLQIQLADILASSISYALTTTRQKNIKTNVFANSIVESKLMNIHCHTVFPTTHIENIKEESEGNNILDYLSTHAQTRKEEYNSIIQKFKR